MRGTRALIVPVVCVLFMSSCSWIKRVRARAPRNIPASAGIQPAPEQQKAAMELLRRMNSGKTEDVPTPEQPGEAQPQQPSPGQEESPMGGQGVDAPLRETGQPSATTAQGVDSPELPEQTPLPPTPDTGEYGGNVRDPEPSVTDPAMQHGLRSPSLPKLLPMDMDGKLNPGI